jgi:hypothetical protein
LAEVLTLACDQRDDERHAQSELLQAADAVGGPDLRLSWTAPSLASPLPSLEEYAESPAARAPTVPVPSSGALDDALWSDAVRCAIGAPSALSAFEPPTIAERNEMAGPVSEIRGPATLPVASSARSTWFDTILAALRSA